MEFARDLLIYDGMSNQYKKSCIEKRFVHWGKNLKLKLCNFKMRDFYPISLCFRVLFINSI